MATTLKTLGKKIIASRTFKVASRVGFLLAPQLVLMAIGAYDQAANAQGLVGAPVDPRYGQSNEVGQLADFGYDTARDISRVVTALSTVPSSMAGMKIAFGQRDGGESAMNVAKGLGVGFGGPTAVHLIGTFAINNFGGLGGGLKSVRKIVWRAARKPPPQSLRTIEEMTVSPPSNSEDKPRKKAGPTTKGLKGRCLTAPAF